MNPREENRAKPLRFGNGPLLFPAIDLRGGRVIRLVRGEMRAEISYDADPLTAAREWIAEGAKCLHLIDLGSAFGELDSASIILKIARTFPVPVQAGGGIRDEEKVERFLGGGVGRVIVGTRALKDPSFLREMVARWGPERIVLAIDMANGRVRVSGWTEKSALDLEGGIRFAVESGVRHLLVTAIDRDGTLAGPDLTLSGETLRRAGLSGLLVTLAGGISRLEDVRGILDLKGPALEGVVVGRALYEGTIHLGEALALVEDYGRKDPSNPC